MPNSKYALAASDFLLQWIKSCETGFPDEGLLDDAVSFAKLAMHQHERDSENVDCTPK